jgi:hypothetical protein
MKAILPEVYIFAAFLDRSLAFTRDLLFLKENNLVSSYNISRIKNIGDPYEKAQYFKRIPKRVG